MNVKGLKPTNDLRLVTKGHILGPTMPRQVAPLHHPQILVERQINRTMKITIKKCTLSVILLLLIVAATCETYYIVLLKFQHRQSVTSFNELMQWYRSRCVEYENSFRLCDLVEQYSTKGELKKALAWADLCVSLFDESDDSWYQAALEQRGNVYFKMQDYPNAIKDYSCAIGIDSINFPKYDLYFKRGMAYKNIGLDKEAVDDFCYGIMLVKRRNGNMRLRDALNSEELIRYEDLFQYLKQHNHLCGVLVQEP